MFSGFGTFLMRGNVVDLAVAVGDVINAVVAFVLVASAIYFLVVAPLNAMNERFKKPAAEPAPARECPECLSEIPGAAQRCKFCSATVG